MLLSGMKAPSFSLLDKDGKKHNLNDYLGKKIVLYFYPKDNTTGCTKQALGYKNNYSRFIEKDIIVIGISKDSVKSHKNFVEKYDLPFILLSDESLEVLKQYDVWHEKKLYGKTYMGVVRTTYIINEEGMIIYSDNKVKAESNALDVLKILNK